MLQYFVFTVGRVLDYIKLIFSIIIYFLYQLREGQEELDVKLANIAAEQSEERDRYQKEKVNLEEQVWYTSH